MLDTLEKATMESGANQSRQYRRRSVAALLVLTALLLASAIFSYLPKFPLNVSPVDLLMLGAAAWALLYGIRQALGRELFLGMVGPLILISAGTLVGVLAGMGGVEDAFELVRDCVPPILFVAVVILTVRTRGRGLPVLLAGTTVLVAVPVILEYGARRPSGLFDNPNYPAHFVAMLMISACLIRPTRPPFWMIQILGSIALVLSASFSAILSLGVVGAVWLVVLAVRGRHRVGIAMLMGLTLVGAIFGVPRMANELLSTQSPTLSNQRFDQTGSVRDQLWQSGLGVIAENPLGVGALALKRGDISALHLGASESLGEFHADILDMGVQAGVLGIVGLVWLFVRLWRFRTTFGPFHALLVFVVLASLSRQTINFRHMWVLLGITLGGELCKQLQRQQLVDKSSLQPPVEALND